MGDTGKEIQFCLVSVFLLTVLHGFHKQQFPLLHPPLKDPQGKIAQQEK